MTAQNTSTNRTRPRNWQALLAFNYVRYSLMNLFLIGGICLMALGGFWTWGGLLLSFVLIGFVEELVGDAGDENVMPPVWYLNLMLYLSLPLLVILTLVMINSSTATGNEYIDAAVSFFGFDPEAARASSNFITMNGGFATLGMFYAFAGVNVAHELVHRTDSPFDVTIGRWLLAFSWDTGFSIEHVYGHHKNVGTDADPATARRGEYVIAFVLRSAVGQWINALRQENARLKRAGKSGQIWRNRFWRGQAMSATIVATYIFLAGPIGLLWAAYAAAIAKIYFEIVNYVEHYGLVRVPGTRVEPRHSWDSYRWFSTGMFYNLPLHSHHHQFATKPFWTLQKAPGQTPVMPLGYMPMILMSFIPPLWKRVITPLLADWDRRLASPEERDILKRKGVLIGT